MQYRLSVKDDELDDYEEGTHINVDDDLGDYGMDDDEEEDAPAVVVGVPVTVTETIVVVEEEPDAPPEKKPVAKAVAKKRAMCLRALNDLDAWLAGALPAAAE